MDRDALKALTAVLSNTAALQLLPGLLSNPEALQQFLAVQIPATGSASGTQQQHGSFYDFLPLLIPIS